MDSINIFMDCYVKLKYISLNMSLNTIIRYTLVKATFLPLYMYIQFSPRHCQSGENFRWSFELSGICNFCPNHSFPAFEIRLSICLDAYSPPFHPDPLVAWRRRGNILLGGVLTEASRPRSPTSLPAGPHQCHYEPWMLLSPTVVYRRSKILEEKVKRRNITSRLSMYSRNVWL